MIDRGAADIQYSQHFLRDGRLIDRILAKSSISAGELVLDIGSGRGLITERLAALGAKVRAIEKDPRLAMLLRRRFANSSEVVRRQWNRLSHRINNRRHSEHGVSKEES